MDKDEIRYFDEKFSKVHSRIDGAMEEIHVVRTELIAQQQKHKMELLLKIEGLTAEIKDNAQRSAVRWTAIDKDMDHHTKSICKNIEDHEKRRHDVAKTIGILVGVVTLAAVAASAILWLIQHSGVLP